MVSTNGRADIVGPPITLGDFLPERREVIINGQAHSAWVTINKRYPRSIMARLDRAARVYNNAIAPLLDENAPEQLRLHAAEVQPEAWQQYITDAVMLLVPDVLESEIELVDSDSLENLLKHLGYFQDRVADDDSVESEDLPADEAIPLTGASSPVDSADSTQVTQPINS